MSLPTPDPRYPVGQVSPGDPVAHEQVRAWIDDIAALPADLLAHVERLLERESWS